MLLFYMFRFFLLMIICLSSWIDRMFCSRCLCMHIEFKKYTSQYTIWWYRVSGHEQVFNFHTDTIQLNEENVIYFFKKKSPCMHGCSFLRSRRIDGEKNGSFTRRVNIFIIPSMNKKWIEGHDGRKKMCSRMQVFDGELSSATRKRVHHRRRTT